MIPVAGGPSRIVAGGPCRIVDLGFRASQCGGGQNQYSEKGCANVHTIAPTTERQCERRLFRLSEKHNCHNSQNIDIPNDRVLGVGRMNFFSFHS